MLFINSNSNDPYYNLASEEFLLKNFSEDVFLLYVNEPSIVVGKHQNAMAEINFEFVQKNGIKVARRLSGGGTVYHDRGNLNFCFIQTTQDKSKVNFSKFLEPIIKILNDLGVDAVAGEKNDILVDGLKVSGNAEHIYKNRVLHHGTLLFDSELDVLNRVLLVNLERFKDRSVQSRRSPVANISTYLKHPLTKEAFREKVFEGMRDLHDQAQPFTFSDSEVKKITSLYIEKFSTWSWNFGYSPDYEYTNENDFGSDHYKIYLHVVKGLITKIEFYINHQLCTGTTEKLQFLVSKKPSFTVLQSSLPEWGVGKISKAQLMHLLFKYREY